MNFTLSLGVSNVNFYTENFNAEGRNMVLITIIEVK